MTQIIKNATGRTCYALDCQTATPAEWEAGKEQSRYVVSFAPANDVERECKRLGMKDGDDTSYWDWIEPHHCEQTRTRRTFHEAVEHARAVLPQDVCGEVRIARERLVQEQDDLGNIYRRKVWEEDAVWYIHEATDAPSEDNPEHRYP